MWPQKPLLFPFHCSQEATNERRSYEKRGEGSGRMGPSQHSATPWLLFRPPAPRLGQPPLHEGPGSQTPGSAWRSEAFAGISGVSLLKAFFKTNGMFLNFRELWGKQARGKKNQTPIHFLATFCKRKRKLNECLWLINVEWLK